MLKKGFRLFAFGFGRSVDLPEGLFVTQFFHVSLARLRELFADASDERGELGGRKDLLPRTEDGALDLGDSVVFPMPGWIYVQNGMLSGITWSDALQHCSLAEIQTLLARAVERHEVDMSRLVRPAGRGAYHHFDERTLEVERALGRRVVA